MCSGQCGKPPDDAPRDCGRAVGRRQVPRPGGIVENPPVDPKRPSGAGRPPEFLGDLTVTSLTVQHRDRPESIRLTAEPRELKVSLLDGQQRPFAELRACPDGLVALELNEPGGGGKIEFRIGLDGVPRVTARNADDSFEAGRGRYGVDLVQLIDQLKRTP